MKWPLLPLRYLTRNARENSIRRRLELKPTRTQMEGAWVEYDLGPITIGVGCHPAWKPSREGTTVAFEVEDFDDAYTKLKERGVTFDMEKTETPVCWMAQFRDPDGNKLVIHKRK